MTQANHPGNEKKRAKRIRGDESGFAPRPVSAILLAAAVLLFSFTAASAAPAKKKTPTPAKPSAATKKSPAASSAAAPVPAPALATSTPVLDIEYGSKPIVATSPVIIPEYSSATVSTASSPMDVSKAASATASASSTAAPATPSLYLQFYNETYTKCMSEEITEDILDFMIEHFDSIQNGFENEAIVRTVGCLALEREDGKTCDKFEALPDNSKNSFPYQTYIEACREKVDTFKVMKDAFTGKDCRKKMEAYCGKIDVCKRSSPDGKICTCPLYAVLKCGIPENNTMEQCDGLRPQVEAVLSGKGKDVVERHAQAVIALCRKAVLGMNPMENERDIGASVSLFLGGLFSGAKWPVFDKDANPEKFGVPPEYAYWHDYVYKHHASCLKHLGIFKEGLCDPYSMVIAHEKEQAAMKKAEEEAAAAKTEESGKETPKDGGEKAKENK